jgi:predicted ATPase with chaperone activity
VRKQSVHANRITRTQMHAAFRSVVIEPALLDQLGPALNSGRAIFIYGAAGTGKTFIAKRLADALSGLVLVPYAIAVNETVVRVFDPQAHLEIEPLDPPSNVLLAQGHDPRFVVCERPVIVSGGELTAEMLELHSDAATHEYTAPLQMKANNGLLLIDDLGRQRIDPRTLFNRWIVPMEEQCDYLTGARGQHFRVPFDLVLVFSTNLDPGRLADEAFLRRIGSKICFEPVTRAQYQRIWDDVCHERGLTCEPHVLEFVVRDLYGKHGTPMLPCHPRDLLGMALDFASYRGDAAALTPETLQWAWDNYFVAAAGE